MTAYGVSSMFFHEYTLEEIFAFISLAGLNAMEFWPETPHFWLRDLPIKEVAACRKRHAEISTFFMHSPVLDLNPCSINPDVAEISVSTAVRSLALCPPLDAPVLTVHPGRRTAKRPPSKADFARFDHYLSVLRDAAWEHEGIVSMENMEPAINSLICTPKRMREVLDAEPWLKFTLDTSHALAASEETVLHYIELCGDRLVNVHISRVEDGRLHLPLDQSPAMARILEALNDQHYSGPLILEIDDLNFAKAASAEEKCEVLKKDVSFMQQVMGKD